MDQIVLRVLECQCILNHLFSLGILDSSIAKKEEIFYSGKFNGNPETEE